MNRRGFLKFIAAAPIIGKYWAPKPKLAFHRDAFRMAFGHPYPKIGDTIIIKKPFRPSLRHNDPVSAYVEKVLGNRNA